jgi:hypothetical protein
VGGTKSAIVGVLASTRGKGNAVQERAIVLIGSESVRRRAYGFESGFHHFSQTERESHWLQRSGLQVYVGVKCEIIDGFSEYVVEIEGPL